MPQWGTYEFRVRAVNDVGISAALMAHGHCTIPAMVPSLNPSNVYAEGETPNDLTVRWTPLPRKEWNGPDFHYIVRYRPDDNTGSQFKEIKVDDPYADHYVIPVDNGDGPWQPYEVQVQSANRLGPSATAPETVKGHTGQGGDFGPLFI